MRTNETIVVNAATSEGSAPGFKVQDIYYVLFRHKWKIIILSLLGFIAGGTAWFVLKPDYVSKAKVLVRFVRETRDVVAADGTSIRTPDSRGENIINSEIDLLSSLDLARDVVTAVGATNIVKGVSEAEAIGTAVGLVRARTSAEAPRRSSVLHISFGHSDPVTAKMVMSGIVAAYLKMHTRVHTSSDILADASRQVEMRRSSLGQIEGELRRLKNELGIVSLDTAKTAVLEQMNKISGEILETEALLAQHRAALGAFTNSVPTGPSQISSNIAEIPPQPPIPSAKISEYRSILGQIEALSQRESQLLVQFKPESPFVRAVRDLLADNEQRKLKVESEFPGIAATALMASTQTSVANGNRGQINSQLVPIDNSASAMAMVRSLSAKLSTLREQMVQLQTNAARLASNEAEITELQRRKEIEEKQYTYHYNALEQARVDETLNQDKISGLSVLESATPAAPDRQKILKIAGGLAVGGLVLGIALAFALEFFLDQSVRRPSQVERSLRLPLFLSVPRLPLNGSPFPGIGETTQRKLLPSATGGSDRKEDEAAANNGNREADASPEGEMVALSTGSGSISDYAEALRDRLMMYFQLHGLNHKPKLVGVTSCGKGAGVTTVASTLAASLSETGDGNVLYVDVNPDKGPSVHPFHRGKLMAGIRTALEQSTRETTKVQENLYMVSLADPASGRVGVIPKTLAGLVPKMKASDYDYIIFDLPPITQTSATSKVAGLLDMTFVVLESEKTQSDLAKKAIDLLTESRANVAAVLNKHHRYMPKQLDTDL